MYIFIWFIFSESSLTLSTTAKFINFIPVLVFIFSTALWLYISTVPSGKGISFLLFHRGWSIACTSLHLLEK